MRILDWRPWPERWLAGSPADGRRCGPVGKLAGAAADALAARRAARRRPPPDGVLIVSVGNLRLGGTGKTPVVLALAQALATGGWHGAVLLRGYGSRREQPLVVTAGDRRASDEARLLAAGLDGDRWTVLQARRRPDGLRRLLARTPRPDVVLIEDGYQTPGIGRHLDVLILDRWTLADGVLRPVADAVLPLGPYRETARGAARAQIWLLETARAAELGAVAAVGQPRICGFARRHELVAAGGGPSTGSPFPRERWGLLSGVARPENFEVAAAALLPRTPVLAVRCSDHCPYDDGQLARIFAAGRREGVTVWATTAKDWIKLQGRWPTGPAASVVRQTVAWNGAQTLPALVGERLAELVGRRGRPG